MPKINRASFHATLPPLLQASARRKARKMGLTFGAYIQRLIEADLVKPLTTSNGNEL